jgi:hypothetical protein
MDLIISPESRENVPLVALDKSRFGGSNGEGTVGDGRREDAMTRTIQDGREEANEISKLKLVGKKPGKTTGKKPGEKTASKSKNKSGRKDTTKAKGTVKKGVGKNVGGGKKGGRRKKKEEGTVLRGKRRKTGDGTLQVMMEGAENLEPTAAVPDAAALVLQSGSEEIPGEKVDSRHKEAESPAATEE